MDYDDDFFEDLMVLGDLVRQTRVAMQEPLAEDTMTVLEEVHATLSGRAVEIVDILVREVAESKKQMAMPHQAVKLRSIDSEETDRSPADLADGDKKPNS